MATETFDKRLIVESQEKSDYIIEKISQPVNHDKLNNFSNIDKENQEGIELLKKYASHYKK